MSRSTWKDYFSFTKKERIAVFILLAVIAVFVVLPFFFSPELKAPEVGAVLTQNVDAAQGQTVGNGKSTPASDSLPEEVYANPPVSVSGREIHYFYFDPNTLDTDGWKRLGLRDKTIRTIINYRNKGGRFRQPSDIKKIYGLRDEEAVALIPYIRIPSTATTSPQDKATVNTLKKEPPRKTYKKININTATAEDWKSLPGIGDVLSNRIVKFRNAVHGFKSVDDIKKTYGLPDSTYRLILPYLFLDSNIQNN